MASTGNVAEEMVARSIENQQDAERDQDADLKESRGVGPSRLLTASANPPT